MSKLLLATVIAAVLSLGSVSAASAGNLLRNGSFQDDWITKLTEVKCLHYSFAAEHYNRRDYNPAGVCA